MSTWHVPEPVLAGWVAGTTSLASAASVEQHLVACLQCQQAVANLTASARPPQGRLPDLERVWVGVRERIEPSPLNLVGRWLCRLGMRESDAVLLAASPSLTGPWLAGLALTLAFAVGVAALPAGPGVSLFLLLAPLIPVAGVAAAHGSEIDRTFEVTLAAPYSRLRLLLLRTGAVVVTTVPLTVLAGLVLPGPWWLAAVWLLPALAFVALSLAAATFLPLEHAAGGVALGWLAVCVLAERGPGSGELVGLFGATALVTYLVLALAAVAVLATRAQRLNEDGGRA